MRTSSYISIASGLIAASLQVAAVASPQAGPPDATQAAGFNPHNFAFTPGIYRCELNRSVHVRQVSSDMRSAVVHWDKKDYTLQAVNARTGALRYEDPASGLVWLVIVGKSMLLDTKHGKQLANECKV